MDMDQMRRAIDPIKTKMRLLAGRAVLALLKDAVTVQVNLLAEEPKSAEQFQQYGFRSRPLAGAEGIYLSLGGNRDHMVILCVDDRRYQLNLCEDGEVALYDHLGKYVLLKEDGSIVVKADTKVRMEVPLLEVTGEVRDRCDAGGVTMAAMRAMHNGHTHNENNTSGPCNTPNQVFP